MPTPTPETVRSATYLATRERLDASRKDPKCKAPNRPCGDRCIPPGWKCRLKGEGTDTHSRVVSGDPLAGAASILRGQARLRRGVVSGNIVEIQGGRASIERGIVKAVPGQNLKQKQALRKTINRTLLPLASGLFGLWVLRRGHEGLGLMVPQYKDGLGRNIELSIENAVNWSLDQVPVLGRYRSVRRQSGAIQAQRLGIAISRGVRRAPTVANPTDEYLGLIDRRRLSTYTGLTTQINGALDKAHTDQSSYNQFRSQIIGTVLGATKDDGSSIYSETAAAHYMARQFSVDPGVITNHKEGESKGLVIARVSRNLGEMRGRLRMDMQVRGLNPSDIKDVERYTDIALASARPRFASLPEADREIAENQFRGYVRDLARRKAVGNSEITTTQMASDLYKEAAASFDSYFKDFGRAAANETRPQNSVAASNMATDVTRIGLISTANRLKRTVGLPENYEIRNASHAELVIQRAYHERVVPGTYSGNRRSTWSSSDADIRYAAEALEWNGQGGIDGAVDHLRQNGFPRLAPRPRVAGRPTGPQRPPASGSAAPRAARRPRRSRDDIISMLMRGQDGLSREAAEAEADRIIARRRGDALDDLPLRVRAYLEARTDLKEGPARGKPCGASHIPKTHDCRKGSASAPAPPENAKQASSNNIRILAGALAATAVVGAGVYVAHDMRSVAKNGALFTASPPIRSVIRDAKKEFGVKNSSEAMGKYYTQKSGLKPGDVVYYRTSNDMAAHFGVYLGEGKDGKVRAVMANTKENRVGFIDVFEVGTTRPEAGDAANFIIPPLQKAPSIKGLTRRTNEETVQRALRALGSDYNFTLTKNNCEALANAIAYDTPKSQQLERFSKLTRAVADATVGNRQRVQGAVRRARGQKQGPALTAKQLLQRLNKDDSTFLSPEGKQIAEQHYKAFFGPQAKLDASENAAYGDLLTPEQLWQKIQGYDDATKATAIRDYLLLVRLSFEAPAEN